MQFFPSLAPQVSPFAQTASLGLPSWAWLLIITLIIVIVWWLLVRSANQERGIEASHEAHEATRAEVVTTIEPDDLAILEGIGPKVKSALAAAGIETFQQLSTANVERLKEILESAGYQYMDPTTWPEQANLLAEGKMEEFQQLADKLKGGRRA